MYDLSKIKQLIQYFRSNYQNYGDIFGISTKLPNINDFFPTGGCGETAIFISNEYIINAWREAVLESFVSNHIEHPSRSDYETSVANSILINRAKKNVDDIVNLCRVIHELSRLYLQDAELMVYPRTLGLELLLYGYEEAFYEMNKDLVDTINESAPKYLLVHDPAELYSLVELDRKYGIKTTIINFLDYLLDHISIDREVKVDYKIIFQESCILERWIKGVNIFDKLKKFFGDNIVRHPLGGELTICCGEFMWLLEPIISINNASERLASLIHFGGNNIAVACPRSLYIFRVASRRNKGFEDAKIMDIVELIYKIMVK